MGAALTTRRRAVDGAEDRKAAPARPSRRGRATNEARARGRRRSLDPGRHQDILTRSGYAVDVVPNGVEALRRLEVDTFDLVITDLRMPEMSGPELIVQMQQDATYNKIPIVVLATGAESADLVRLKVDARVSKPFVPKTLLNAVAALIG